MGAQAETLQEESLQRERLRVFLGWLLPIVLVTEALNVASWLLLRDATMGRVSLLVLTFAATLLVARRVVRRGRVRTAFFTVALGILVLALLVVVVQPDVYPALMFAPIMVATLALSFAPSRTMGRILLAAGAAAAAIALVGRYPVWPTPPPTAPVRLLNASALVAAAGLTLLLLWQFDARLRRTLARLGELDRFKTQLINTTAHELNTPLTPIRLQLHLLRAGPFAPTDPDQRRAIEILDRNTERLAHLVREVLELARLESGRFAVQMKAVDLARVVREVADSFEAAAQSAGVAIATETPAELVVPADPNRLVQVLYNLLGNALKFTPRGGAIRVVVLADDASVTLRVTDSGVGILPGDLAKLFRPFSQVAPADGSPHPGGTGLGLYICRGIVELHGGRIWAESGGAGAGATFAVRLPRGSAAPPTPAGVPAAEAVQAGREGLFTRRARELV